MIPELKRHRQEDHHKLEGSLMYKRKCRPARGTAAQFCLENKNNQKTRQDRIQGLSTQISCSKECFQVIQEENQYLELSEHRSCWFMCKVQRSWGKYTAFLCFVDPVSLIWVLTGDRMG